jgi:hypothetical protein
LKSESLKLLEPSRSVQAFNGIALTVNIITLCGPNCLFCRIRVLRKTFGPKRDEVAGEWRRLHNGELLIKN